MSTNILEEASKVTSGDKRRDYDSATKNHERIAKLWNTYLDIRKEPTGPITAENVAWMMVMLKIARNEHTAKPDNYVDAAGYIRCAAQIAGIEDE
jgi:hypothetical protein